MKTPMDILGWPPMGVPFLLVYLADGGLSGVVQRGANRYVSVPPAWMTLPGVRATRLPARS